MARWRLINAHYLNVESYFGQPVEWEYKETDRNTGRANRKMFPVPLHLDPNQPGDCNYPEEGSIIVCHKGKGLPRDIVFLSEPTPEMEPLDEEAEAISVSLRQKWEHPIESLAPNGTMSTQEKAFMQNMMQTFAQASNNMSMIPSDSITISKGELAKLVQDQVAAALAKPTEPASRRA